MNDFIFTSPNIQRKTITIREYRDGRKVAKYRTIRLKKEEFKFYTEQATQEDWRKLLDTRPDKYYLVDKVAKVDGQEVHLMENPVYHRNEYEAKGFLYWYKVGRFSSVLDNELNTPRAEAVRNITHEVGMFAVTNKEFMESDRPETGIFVFNFSMYLVGRLDERLNRNDNTQKTQ